MLRVTNGQDIFLPPPPSSLVQGYLNFNKVHKPIEIVLKKVRFLDFTHGGPVLAESEEPRIPHFLGVAWVILLPLIQTTTKEA